MSEFIGLPEKETPALSVANVKKALEDIGQAAEEVLEKINLPALSHVMVGSDEQDVAVMTQTGEAVIAASTTENIADPNEKLFVQQLGSTIVDSIVESQSPQSLHIAIPVRKEKTAKEKLKDLANRMEFKVATVLVIAAIAAFGAQRAMGSNSQNRSPMIPTEQKVWATPTKINEVLPTKTPIATKTPVPTKTPMPGSSTGNGGGLNGGSTSGPTRQIPTATSTGNSTPFKNEVNPVRQNIWEKNVNKFFKERIVVIPPDKVNDLLKRSHEDPRIMFAVLTDDGQALIKPLNLPKEGNFTVVTPTDRTHSNLDAIVFLLKTLDKSGGGYDFDIVFPENDYENIPLKDLLGSKWGLMSTFPILQVSGVNWNPRIQIPKNAFCFNTNSKELSKNCSKYRLSDGKFPKGVVVVVPLNSEQQELLIKVISKSLSLKITD